MVEIFLFGTFWFWLLVVAEIVALIAFVEHENGIGATVSVGVFFALIHFFGDINVVTYATANPWQIVALVFSYFALGAGWGIFKWFIFVKDRVELYKDLRDKFLKEKELESGTAVPEYLKVEWSKRVKEHNRYEMRNNGQIEKPPTAKENKARIIRWMSFWPISLMWSFVDDFVKRVCKTIYYRIASMLQRISDNIFVNAKVSDDIVEINE